MHEVKHFIEAIFNPFFLIVFCFLIGGLVLLNSKRIKYSSFILGFALFFLMIFSTGFFPKWLTESLEAQYPVVTEVNPKIKWIVVLGGGQAQYAKAMAHNQLFTASIRRVIEGVRLYRQLDGAQLILLGGEHEAIPEAKQLAILTQWFAIPKMQVILEERGTNTAEQMIHLYPLLKSEPFYLVTSAIHMPRAILLAKKYKLNPIPAPTDFTYYWQDERWEKMWIPNPKNLVYVNIVWHELLGEIWFFLKGL